MPKKEMSAEERKAFGEKMKAARAAKKAQVEETVINETKDGVSEDQYQDLLRRFEELKNSLQSQPQTPQVNTRGHLVGTYEPYSTNPNYYPDPRARLAQEPKLQRFAFPMNYELDWEIQIPPAFQTIDGVWRREPRFMLALKQIAINDDGEHTEGRYTLKKLSLHEDPQAALQVAHDHGFDVDSVGEKEFLDEMRYLRMRDWLLEIFYPQKPTYRKHIEKVFGNRLVEYSEAASGDVKSFDQIDKS